MVSYNTDDLGVFLWPYGLESSMFGVSQFLHEMGAKQQLPMGVMAGVAISCISGSDHVDIMLRFSQLFLAWSTSKAVYCPWPYPLLLFKSWFD